MRPPARNTEDWAAEQIRVLDNCLDADAAASIIKTLLCHYVDTSMPYVQRQALLSWLERNQKQVNHDSLLAPCCLPEERSYSSALTPRYALSMYTCS
jgi:hypothetical protein